jgi:signal transduction histidine kinase/ActR/RegA family two-component response regulator
MTIALPAKVCRLFLLITTAILLPVSISNAADEPRRVLLLDSFDKQFAPFEVFKATLRNELREQSPAPLAFYEFSIDSARSTRERDDFSFLNDVLSTFKEQQPDLIVTLGSNAARFAQKNRRQLFASKPVLFTAVDERALGNSLGNSVTLNSTTVAIRNDFPEMIETIRHIVPKTKTVAVVLGNSPLEQFWRKELDREFERFQNQLTFTWFNNLSFAEMLNRSATLPANSAIFYIALSVDAEGITRSQENVISELHAKANAPLFALQSGLVGKGVVGSLGANHEDWGRKTAAIALRLLEGEAKSIQVPPQIPGPAVFDWRELRRWNIDENRLPSGSMIQYRSLTTWEQYKWYLIVGAALFLFELILLVGLAVNLFKRRESERLAQDINRRLIQSQEMERSRLAELEGRTLQLSRLASQLTLAEQNARQQLARTLHDGLQQLLFTAGVKLDKALNAGPHDDHVGLLQRARTNVKEAMEAARTLSVNLFPPVLYLGGLPAALSWLARRTQEQYGIAVNVSADPQANPEAGDVRILLFEGVRELLFNAVKHAQVDRVDVKLAVEPGDTIQIQVSDEGVGFDPAITLYRDDQHQGGLGLFSIRERFALLGGHLDIQSGPGKGARFILTVPRAGNHGLATDEAEAGRHDARQKENIVFDPGRKISETLRILIVDDHAVARAGLRELFSNQPTLQVVGEAGNGFDAISQAMSIQPDVVVMDVDMPQMNGINATIEIRHTLPHIQIVGLSTHDDESIERSMRKAGAVAYFTKKENADRLLAYLLSLRAQAKAAS